MGTEVSDLGDRLSQTPRCAGGREVERPRVRANSRRRRRANTVQLLLCGMGEIMAAGRRKAGSDAGRARHWLGSARGGASVGGSVCRRRQAAGPGPSRDSPLVEARYRKDCKVDGPAAMTGGARGGALGCRPKPALHAGAAPRGCAAPAGCGGVQAGGTRAVGWMFSANSARWESE